MAPMHPGMPRAALRVRMCFSFSSVGWHRNVGSHLLIINSVKRLVASAMVDRDRRQYS